MNGRGAKEWDVAIVGGGHNGLVAAFYLARAGLETVVLERREIVGGCAVTEEFSPGFHASTGAYVLSMLREPIWKDLRLVERGVTVDPAGPALNLGPDGSALLLHDDVAETQQEFARFSPRDSRALPGFEDELGRIASLITPLIDTTPPDPRKLNARELARLARLGGMAARHRALIADATFLFGTSATQYLREWFESPQVLATLGWHAINDSTAGPSTPGTAYVLLHDHAAEQAGGGIRQWGFVRGGIGRLPEAMAAAAREAGAVVRTEAPVERITVESGRASSVVLASGEVVRARRILSNADPKTTLLGLLDTGALPERFAGALEAYRCEGTSVKINLAVDQLPMAAAMNGRGVQPYHGGIAEINPTIEQMDAAQAEARAGRPALDPHIELCVPTVHDPSLAPSGKHVVTIDVNSQPYTLADGTWDDIRDEVADRAIAKIGEYFPNVPGAILDRQVLAPPDLERLLGIGGGHALHGEMAFDQLFNLRPVRGWGEYRTPVRDLWICGAGTHPGGGVTGANGRNCAREVIREAKRLRTRLWSRA
ncbi:MAG: NAD(P)/FAD-dependent oxidoreductase [Actinomycetota bacterium]|nr:NAD(P)/FAD-dependent oxidoreductase [Actinomycetota bacterium]